MKTSSLVQASAAVLDNPVHEALTHGHQHLGERRGQVWRYRPQICEFAGLPDEPTEQDWRDAAHLFGPGGQIQLRVEGHRPPAHWDVEVLGRLVQLVDDGVGGRYDPHLVRLGERHVPQMLALVERTRPGPFLVNTIAMGSYYGVFEGDRLVAMAGERVHPPGWREISAVCTDAEHRGRGLATRLIRHLVADIDGRGERAMLHTWGDNHPAIALYLELGFTLRRDVHQRVATVPADG